MLMRDRLDVVFTVEDFVDLYPADGRPGLSPGQWALVSVLQFAENLSDRQAAVRNLGRLELVGESLRAALEELAEADEQWLLPLLEPEWGKRYGRRVEIGKIPGGKPAVAALGETIGRDGQRVLAALWATQAPRQLRELPQVEILRRVWVHQYYWDSRGTLRWREGNALPPASLRFDSPY
ncbi:hypothetical protein ACFQX5_51065, partial [Streptomyces lutosisoli]